MFREWNSIGVNVNPLCEDEFDSYAPAICRMLTAGADEVELAVHLGWQGTKAMGWPAGDEQRGHDSRIAGFLRGVVGRG